MKWFTIKQIYNDCFRPQVWKFFFFSFKQHIKSNNAIQNKGERVYVSDWRDNNNSFRSEYTMELEHYLHECHPNSLLKGEPHVNSKLKA